MLGVVLLGLVNAFVLFVNQKVGVIVDLVRRVLGGVQVVVNVGLARLLVAAVAVHENVFTRFRRDWKACLPVFAGEHDFKSPEAFVLFFSAERRSRIDVDLGKLVLDHNGIPPDYPVVGVPDVDPARQVSPVSVRPVHIDGGISFFRHESRRPSLGVIIVGGGVVIVLPQKAVGVLQGGLGEHVGLRLPYRDGSGLALKADERGESSGQNRKDRQNGQDHQKRHAPGGGKISERLFHITQK